ncbi:MAG: ornithine carbamoyltransferase [Verrucomicrobia bacterium]|nr:ornithine carbamoyltransferase [Verrucomicrobiota bacterium]
MKHLITLADWTSEDVESVLELAAKVKAKPGKYAGMMAGKTLLMVFEKPSLRTRVSFETGMTQLGGHAIYYDMSTSPLGAGKETIEDTVQTVSRYVDVIMARLFEHDAAERMAASSSVPVINALTNYSHPCQILADLQTIKEMKGRLAGLKLAYLGDANNNVTHSLMFGCALTGMNISIGCPVGADYSPAQKVIETAMSLAIKDAEVEVTHDARQAARDADIVYTDSWMSYHIAADKLEERVRVFTPYQVNADLMGLAAPDAIFMNCLPAVRGYEQTADVIDGPQSVVFDEAENRLHVQKAVMLRLLDLA